MCLWNQKPKGEVVIDLNEGSLSGITCCLGSVWVFGFRSWRLCADGVSGYTTGINKTEWIGGRETQEDTGAGWNNRLDLELGKVPMLAIYNTLQRRTSHPLERNKLDPANQWNW